MKTKVQDPRARELIMRLVNHGKARLCHVDCHDYGDDIGVLSHLFGTYLDKTLPQGSK